MRACVAGLVAAALLLSCISERTPLSLPGELADCTLPLDRVARGDVIVLVRGQQFLPDTVHVQTGQAVTWVNCEAPGADPHTSTSVSDVWSSPLLQSGEFYSREFDEAGTFDYSCIPHPHMRGSVIVD